MSPLRDCLTEDPIQVMFTGYANQVREVETFLSRLPFAAEYSLAMTVYDKRDFGLVDVIAAGMFQRRDAGRMGAPARMVARRRHGHWRQPK